MSTEERDKVQFKLRPDLRAHMKSVAARRNVDMQDAVAEGIRMWRDSRSESTPKIDASGAVRFGTWLPPAVLDDFRADCDARRVTMQQALAEAVGMWLAAYDPGTRPGFVPPVHRLIVINQKGGVGKTCVSAGIGTALAEAGRRVLLIDLDPQGDLTFYLGLDRIEDEQAGLAAAMARGGVDEDLGELITTLPYESFGGRLDLLPIALGAYRLDVALARETAGERALERALSLFEDNYDTVVVDCPPNLGLVVDAAIYYGRQRNEQDPSGLLVPVQPMASSWKAYQTLMGQVADIEEKCGTRTVVLGLVVNQYDGRGRGRLVQKTVADKFKSLGKPPVLAVLGDLKGQQEAQLVRKPLLVYRSQCDEAKAMRQLAGQLRGVVG